MIASAIGVPIFADECTTNQTRISHARMLVEVNVTKTIPQKITVVDQMGRHSCRMLCWNGDLSTVINVRR